MVFRAQDGTKLVQAGRRMHQVCSKLARSWFKLAQGDPIWLQVGSSSPQVGSKLAPVGPSWRQSGPRDSDKHAQDDPKMGEVGTKTIEMRLNLVPSGLRLSPIWPQDCMKADIAEIYKNQ